MTRSEPTPPTIPGHQFERYVASGGFGDVFAYRDNLGRRVAVKVLRMTALTPEKLEEFRTEASLMASLEHDNVVRVNTFATAPDGRPYISMEYCADHLGNVARSQQLPVHDALAHGIKIASAVDAAHGRGLFHRDIKPANVLVKSNRQPALTDFGIAGGRDADVGQRGVSLQYGAPEVIDEQTDGEVLADVYSLGATVHALLTGYSPMYDPAGPNDDASIIDRALHGTRPRTGRGDVPASLERELQRAMAVDPRARHGSAMVFARALQRVEAELGFAPTSVPFVADDQFAAAPRDRVAGDAEGTRLAPQRIDPTGGDDTSPPPARVPPAAPPHGPAQDLPTRARTGDGHTEQRPDRVAPGPIEQPAPAESAPEPASSSRIGRVVLAVSAAVVVLAGVAAAVTSGGEEAAAPSDDGPMATAPDDGSLFATPVTPTDVRLVGETDQVRVTWSASDGEDVRYVVSFTAGARAGESQEVAVPPLTLSVTDVGDDVCVRVLEVIGSASSEPSREECLG